MEIIHVGGFSFYSNFDSSNLGKVEQVTISDSVINNITSKHGVPDIPDIEFNIWTNPDCSGTEYQNPNRTWFFFGMKAFTGGLMIKINMVDINKQAKMYSQGMSPVYKVFPGKHTWERIRDKPTYTTVGEIFTLSFKLRSIEPTSIMYIAFTYPYSFADLQTHLMSIDHKYLKLTPESKDDIYYVRELLCLSLEGRRVDLITISSYHNISTEREIRLKNLFPDEKTPRPFRFIGKKVVFLSARVHPGETPSSFVFNGILNLLLNKDDQTAVILRRMYVFKLIPFLNPDGVSKGHYRTDTRGINLNRMYLRPSFELHPSIYAARALIRYYHYGFEKEDDDFENCKTLDTSNSSSVESTSSKASEVKLSNKVHHMSITEAEMKWKGLEMSEDSRFFHSENASTCYQGDINFQQSGLFLYLDMHGHASKKGIFMYGNHFQDLERNVECMLLPKIMSINNHNFHFNSCNFTEKNMYCKDRRDGTSREGSGRVAVLKLTGLIQSYTLECNYNTGRIVNVLPPTVRENTKVSHVMHCPPKYTPQIFEEVGRALGGSILDLTGQNPCTRLANSEFHSLNGLRDWLRLYCSNELGETQTPGRLRLRRTTSLRSQGKHCSSVKGRACSATQKMSTKIARTTIPVERKENVVHGNKAIPGPSSSKSHTSNVLPKTRSGLGPQKSMNVKSRYKKDSVSNKQPSTTQELSSKTIRTTQKVPSTPGLSLKPAKQKPARKKGSRDSDFEKSPEPVLPIEKDQVTLQEICYVKDPEGGKKVIAKYKNTENKNYEDNLVVSWDMNSAKPQVFSHKSPKSFGRSAASATKNRNFRVHNFAKPFSSTSKMVMSKRSLRRLTNAAESTAKVDKTKKRKKSK